MPVAQRIVGNETHGSGLPLADFERRGWRTKVIEQRVNAFETFRGEELFRIESAVRPAELYVPFMRKRTGSNVRRHLTAPPLGLHRSRVRSRRTRFLGASRRRTAWCANRRSGKARC